MKGDLIYNGVFLTPAKLGETLAYVSQDLELCPKMSTRQTILFATLLRSPARKRTFDNKKRIDAVLEELGLSSLRKSKFLFYFFIIYLNANININISFNNTRIIRSKKIKISFFTHTQDIQA